LREIDAAVSAEALHRLAPVLASSAIICAKGGQHDDALVVAVAPIGDAAMQPAVIGGNAEAVVVDLGSNTHLVSPVAASMAATCDSEVEV
jgi:hypothetical protein